MFFIYLSCEQVSTTESVREGMVGRLCRCFTMALGKEKHTTPVHEGPVDGAGGAETHPF